MFESDTYMAVENTRRARGVKWPIETAVRSESLNDDSARGYIIKDELVTISNRQTNWTTLGNTPWCTPHTLSKRKEKKKREKSTDATSWDIEIMTMPSEALILLVRNLPTRYVRWCVSFYGEEEISLRFHRAPSLNQYPESCNARGPCRYYFFET